MFNMFLRALAATFNVLKKIASHWREVPWLIIRLSHKFKPTPYIILAGFALATATTAMSIRNGSNTPAYHHAASASDAHSAMGEAPPVGDDAPGH